MEIEDALLLLECTLINEENPDYIEISEQHGCIYILLSKKDYEKIPLHERIMRISALLQFEHEDVLEIFPVIVECLTDLELDELMKIYAKG